jgi:hypothetical protein
VALNQLINLAVAEKVSASRTERYIAERAARANLPKALRILKRAGVGQQPVKGDELSRLTRKKAVSRSHRRERRRPGCAVKKEVPEEGLGWPTRIVWTANYKAKPILVGLRWLFEITDAAPSLTCLRILIDPLALWVRQC